MTSDLKVQCCRCRNKHLESERKKVPSKRWADIGASDLVCPRCSCKSYYKLKEVIHGDH